MASNSLSVRSRSDDCSVINALSVVNAEIWSEIQKLLHLLECWPTVYGLNLQRTGANAFGANYVSKILKGFGIEDFYPFANVGFQNLLHKSGET
ncbi:hypothetical protein SeMB42_g01167 [Synchytrium endobioticum]|uniref:Uncharacterized protein n=1 Tax=Synchytrium endobioticum TaxID=286115 RepID=A0A507DNK7_9FUNG|nr:hypothetical protein SeMB42_g01167 [Synchytrium endobioticum]